MWKLIDLIASIADKLVTNQRLREDNRRLRTERDVAEYKRRTLELELEVERSLTLEERLRK